MDESDYQPRPSKKVKRAEFFGDQSDGPPLDHEACVKAGYKRLKLTFDPEAGDNDRTGAPRSSRFGFPSMQSS